MPKENANSENKRNAELNRTPQTASWLGEPIAKRYAVISA